MRIALLTIATNKYIKFTLPLWESVKQHFLPGHQVDMYVHTDSQIAPTGCKIIPVKHQPFPYPTLMRYHMFVKSRKYYLGDYDYYYYCDADMRFVDTVGEEIFGDMVATQHPGFFNKPRQTFSYETRPQSTACVSPNEGTHYFAGGFNGGRNFLKMAKILATKIQIDINKGIMAVWHDESHLNRYLINHPPDVMLDPRYCYPEPPSDRMNSNILGFKPKLLALNKKDRQLLRT